MFKMNTYSTRVYIMSAPAQLLRNWDEQWPSNHGDLDFGVTERLGDLLHGFQYASDLISILQYMIAFGLCFK
jgi:hypothetical protein